ncbi:MAG: sulfurtransferase TusA family protein [Anaerolineae bacterium]|nr:sulfurtransferase TusA family protein [Anaerolineae bacterium]
MPPDTPIPQPEMAINLCDARCPHVVIGIIAALRQLAAGQVLQVKATDLSAPSNISAWARQSGHRLLEMYEEDGCFVFYLERGAYVSAATPSFAQKEE